MSRVEELSNEILRHLLADFVGRTLTSEELTNGYVGMTLALLKEKLLTEKSLSSVDFDLAFKDLERGDLVHTGPLVPYDNPPGSTVVVIGIFSNREYAYLTEKGYKAAQKVRTESGRKPGHTYVSISGGHFQQSPIGIGENITQSVTATSGAAPVFADLHRVVNESSIEGDDRNRLVAAIEAMQNAHNKPSFRDRYREFIALAADYMTLIGPYVPALAALLTSRPF